MLQDTRIALFLLGELIAVLRANDPDTFKRWLSVGVQDLGEPVVEELLLDWLDPFLTAEEQDSLLGWNLGVSLQKLLAIFIKLSFKDPPDGGCVSC